MEHRKTSDLAIDHIVDRMSNQDVVCVVLSHVFCHTVSVRFHHISRDATIVNWEAAVESLPYRCTLDADTSDRHCPPPIGDVGFLRSPHVALSHEKQILVTRIDKNNSDTVRHIDTVDGETRAPRSSD